MPCISMKRMVRIKAVEPLERFRLRLTFTDGSQKEVDIAPFLRGPIFEPLRNDPNMFRSVAVNARAGTVVWPNGADIDPDVLYLGLKPAWMESEQNVGAK